MLELLDNKPLLCLVTDRELCQYHSLEKLVELAILGGVGMVQLREETASTQEFLSLGKSLQKILKFYSIPFIINDRVDITLALDADGVHLGQSDLPYPVARKILGKKKIIGLSVNTIEEANLAENWSVDYLGVGPIFPTKTKTDIGNILGIDKLSELKKISKHKLIAIGGINIQNINKIAGTGIDGVAVVSAICSSKDPKQSAQKLYENLCNNFKYSRI